MKRLVLFRLICSFCSCISNSITESKCILFKTGKFVLYDQETNTTYKINRGRSIQTEFNLSTGTKSIFKIDWKNNCEYDLYQIESDSLYSTAAAAIGTKPLHVTMTEVTDDYYIFKAKVDGIDFIQSDTIFKVK